jgi:hypothetical protein
MPITDQHKELLFHLYNIEGVYNYKGIAEKLNVPVETIVVLYGEELKEERIKIASIKNIWSAKKMSEKISFKTFYEWYLKQEKKCFYCGVEEEKMRMLLDSKRVTTKRLRGRKLELDRKNPKDESYHDLNNFVLACYWCNNAKTDTFTSDEFKEVGEVFKKIWEKRGGMIMPETS